MLRCKTIYLAAHANSRAVVRTHRGSAVVSGWTQKCYLRNVQMRCLDLHGDIPSHIECWPQSHLIIVSTLAAKNKSAALDAAAVLLAEVRRKCCMACSALLPPAAGGYLIHQLSACNPARMMAANVVEHGVPYLLYGSETSSSRVHSWRVRSPDSMA